MSFAEDLSPFFNPAEFASAALLDGNAVTGIFDTPYAQAFDGIATAEPTFMLASAAAAAATQVSVLVVQGITYRVRSVQADGTGVTTLVLCRQ